MSDKAATPATSEATAEAALEALELPMPVGRDLAVPDMQAFEGMMEIGKQLISTGFLPDAISTPAQCVAIILTGKELGIPMMRSLRQIRVIKGQPSLSAELMRGMFISAGGRIQWLQADDKAAIAKYIRPNGDEYTQRWTVEDARKAGLIHDQLRPKDSWNTYRAVMLQARNTSAAARAFFPDIVGGLYHVHLTDVEYTEVDQPPKEPLKSNEPMTEQQKALVRKLAASHVWDVHQKINGGDEVHKLSDRERVFTWLEKPHSKHEAKEKIDFMLQEIEVRKKAEAEEKEKAGSEPQSAEEPPTRPPEAENAATEAPDETPPLTEEEIRAEEQKELLAEGPMAATHQRKDYGDLS